ncbi:MAG: Asp-tRNA(Asn)/Glu-tRNA(Gln) amidotransferase subunit GatC [Phoenicibacter congonensis]|uniref:Aspartyl/glutamyl-tRNA(Asn/Gln) amidotransferase subunit C n=1 Tax=Phoenicibacter congonensis TaxID=1944646 RepID=A0AA43RI72_9ACTN|nr:Asp-tRNA(Asn)/Glu-tRNA(Gln) amidotransferase subunit GatC [Phoenicibacter congonensis]
MAEYLTQNDVREIAEYTRIGVEDSELEELTGQLNSIIDELQVIREYELDGVEPTFHPIGSLSNVIREDVPVEGFTQEEALENAPKVKDGSFLIPSILGEGGDR